MDKVDLSLLGELRRDARLPIQELAARAGVSRATVRTRIAAMRARGDIRGFTVVTPADAVTSPVRGLMMLAIEGAGAERLSARLAGHPEVRAVHSTNGKWDLVVEIATGTLEDFDTVLAMIRRQPGVRSSETSLLLSTRGA
ncbi:Lrp/AsnC family transcriptional regulator [Profundibacterium mesophilum]|uniref:Isoleucyl-tRNA synthetase n=1 Tax=Profundibacterium mesophilum KAUST100406-0324 TaxID=1037889 RepID=A0A921TCC7_9RHOB|nr:Lrp/AsnC family transcriptional regulator [Profundibacterium mesophilum]KAF0674727.1 isoleucyl-tRNA synthetase [Profundibacterium mesophilum KAUST100406-0324]